MPGRPRTSLIAMLLCIGSIFTTGSPSTAEPHRHYADLLRSGTAALAAENWVDAAKDLRIAAFGMLDEPPLLAEASVRLAIAQAQLDRQSEFVETSQRILDIERRTAGYTNARLSVDERQRFERLIVNRLPERMLVASPSFGRLIETKRREDLLNLPVRQRLQRLETLIADDPSNPEWPMLAADGELERGRLQEAVDHLSDVVAMASIAEETKNRALCQRGRALADGDNCAQALRDLAICGSTATAPVDAARYTSCLIDVGQDQQAADFLAGLDKALRDHPAVRASAPDLVADPGAPADALVLDQATTAPGTSEPPPVAAAETTEASDRRTPSNPTPESSEAVAPSNSPTAMETTTRSRPLTEAERLQLERARELHRSAQSHSELIEPLRLAREVAEARPDSVAAQHLAAVIAYRSSQWATAVRYFRRGGMPPADQPESRFYMAVALQESGEPEEAARVLSSCIDQLEKTAFVERYSRIILEANKP